MNFSEGFGSNIGGNFGTNTSGNTSTSTGSNGSMGNSQSVSNQSVWGPQSGYLEDVYGQGQDAFNNTMGQVNDLTPEIQQQMQQASQAGMGGFQNQLAGGNIAGLQGQVGQNNYLDAMKGQVADDANLLKQQSLGSLDARAAASGMSGSSGYRDQVNKSFDNIDSNAQGQMAQLGYNSFNQGIQNQMAVANGMDQNMNQGVANSALMQQNAMNQYNPAMMGQQVAQNYAQTIGGPTTLTNSSSTSDNSSFGSNNSTSNGFSNGMNMGLNMGGNVNTGGGVNSAAGNGTSSSNSWSFQPPAPPAVPPSDMRLKENIEYVDQIDGVNLYTWDWRDDAPVTSPMNYGVIAQEVAETHPDAVVEGEHGYLTVDYSKLGRAGESAIARMGEQS
jgi:hypothetical protein